MITNLAIQTRQVLADAKLDASDIGYVIFYNEDAEQFQYCSYSEFMEVAEDIDFDEHDPIIAGRRIIHPGLAIVASNWWLRRTTDDEETENWVFQEIPLSMDEMQEGSGDFHMDYAINEIDALTPDYVDLIEVPSAYNSYVKSNNILINGQQFVTDDSDGIDKVYNNEDHVAVIVASNGGQYWTNSPGNTKDPRMLFHPELIKMVIEESYVDMNVFNNDWITNALGLNTSGFSDVSFLELEVRWIPRNQEFMIVYDRLNDDEQMCEQIMINPKAWLMS